MSQSLTRRNMSVLQVIIFLGNFHVSGDHNISFLFSFLGHYCPTGSTQPIGCPGGQAQPNSGQWECESCPAGYYCVSSTDPDPTPCPPYHYCPNGQCFSLVDISNSNRAIVHLSA